MRRSSFALGGGHAHYITRKGLSNQRRAKGPALPPEKRLEQLRQMAAFYEAMLARGDKSVKIYLAPIRQSIAILEASHG